MDDLTVLQLIKKGDESALEFLYKKHYRMMAKLVMRNSGNEDDAKDIFQDALVIFWQKVANNQLELTSKISTYLYSVCQNLWRKELDRKARHTTEEADVADSFDPDRKERVEIIDKCLKNLGETCRNVLTLYYFDRLSMSDIAIKLGFANADTAKTKKYKCKQELDKMIRMNYQSSDFLD